jgi:hypothetical protein
MLYVIFAPLIFVGHVFLSANFGQRFATLKFAISLAALAFLVLVFQRIYSEWTQQNILLISPFLFPCLLMTSLIAIGIGVCIRKCSYIVGFILLIPMFFFMYSSFSVQEQLEKEKERASYFLIQHQELTKYLGHRPDSTFISWKDDSAEEKARYEFSIIGSGHFYAFIDVERTMEQSIFKLACVITTPPQFRDPDKNPCDAHIAVCVDGKCS